MQSDRVAVYDSLHLSHLSTKTRMDIASLLQTSSDRITIEVVNVQRQRDTYNCGPFAAAFATSLCMGEDPSQLRFDELRAHLKVCLQNRKMSPFPSEVVLRHKKVVKILSFEVYCDCRMPDDGSEMVMCEGCQQWFHCNCVRYAGEDNWNCGKCKM